MLKGHTRDLKSPFSFQASLLGGHGCLLLPQQLGPVHSPLPAFICLLGPHCLPVNTHKREITLPFTRPVLCLLGPHCFPINTHKREISLPLDKPVLCLLGSHCLHDSTPHKRLVCLLGPDCHYINTHASLCSVFWALLPPCQHQQKTLVCLLTVLFESPLPPVGFDTRKRSACWVLPACLSMPHKRDDSAFWPPLPHYQHPQNLTFCFWASLFSCQHPHRRQLCL